MAGKFVDGGEKTKENEKFNPYNLFLILILLILSQDVLQMIKAQKLKIKKNKAPNSPNRRVFNILPVHNKQVEQNKEPKEETREHD